MKDHTKERSLADMRRDCKLGKRTRPVSRIVGGSKDGAKAIVRVSRFDDQLGLFNDPMMQSPHGERGTAVGSLSQSLSRYYGG